jgi:hypothetical protein
LQGRGVTIGIPDICIDLARCGYFGTRIEFKLNRVHKSPVSPAQHETLHHLSEAGFLARVSVGFEDAPSHHRLFAPVQNRGHPVITIQHTIHDIAAQILGRSLVVLPSHLDKAHVAAPDNAQELVDEVHAIAALRMGTATDDELLRRYRVLEEQRSQCFVRISTAQGQRSGRDQGDRFLSGKDSSTIDRAAQEKNQRDMSRAQSEKALITDEIDRRANAQVARR